MSRPVPPPSSAVRLARLVVAALAAAALACVALAAPAPAAETRPYAPVDLPGPALSPSPAALSAALRCADGNLAQGPTPVLFVPATGVTPEQNYEWNWKPALRKLGIPFCTIELPDRSLGDIQTAGEYITHAIREVHRRAGRRISLIGHSQGGMVFRWALRFWPDTRAMVDDAIGFAGSNHGTTLLGMLPTCRTLGCPAASLQQADDADFIAAVNSRQETFAGISYTNIRSRFDEVVIPSDVQDPRAASSSLTTGDGRITNVAIQDVCPGDISEHLLVGTTSNTAYALAIDALTHDGPANPGRIAASTCSTPFMPGVDPTNLQANVEILRALPGLASVAGVNLAGVPVVTEEPPLKSYVFAQRAAAPAPTTPAARTRARLRITPTRIPAGRATRLTVRTTTAAGKPLAKQRVRLFGRTVRTNAKGVATLRVRPAKAGLVTARATGNGTRATTKRVRVVPAR